MSETGYMLDTNLFDAVTKGRVAWSSGHAVFVTHVQRDELSRTRDADLRERLLKAFTDIAARSLPTNTSVWDDTRWDEGCWSPEDGMYDRLLQRLTDLDRASGKKPRDSMNQSRDARIAETAI